MDSSYVEQLIKEALPGAIYKSFKGGSYDTPFFDITPYPGYVLRLNFDKAKPWICLKGYRINLNVSNPADALDIKTVYAGDLPATKENDDADYFFLVQLLKNYKCLL